MEAEKECNHFTDAFPGETRRHSQVFASRVGAKRLQLTVVSPVFSLFCISGMDIGPLLDQAVWRGMTGGVRARRLLVSRSIAMDSVGSVLRNTTIRSRVLVLSSCFVLHLALCAQLVFFTHCSVGSCPLIVV